MNNPHLKTQQARAEALAANESDDPRRALAAFLVLEKLEPYEPNWPRRAADCHRTLGEIEQRLEALGRAAANYARAGMLVRASAISRLMLAIDPQHAGALTWLERLPQAAPEVAPRRRALEVKKRPGRAERGASTGTPASSAARQLVAERGLIAVARSRSRSTAQRAAWTQRSAERSVPSGETSVPPRNPNRSASIPSHRLRSVAPEAPPLPSASISSGSWLAVEDADLEVPETDAEPLACSLAPLGVYSAPLREIVHDPVPPALPAGAPSGMFRLAIDAGADARTEQTRHQARQLLPAVPLFAELDPNSLEGLLRQSRLLRVACGQIVFRQGDPPECLFVVVNGSVACIDEAASRTELYCLAENEFFGEAALISNEPRQVTVEAREDCDLLAFDRSAMSTCIAKNPGVIPVLLRFLRIRMIEHLLRTSPLFIGFDTAERRALSRRFELLEIAADSLLIQQGLRSPGLFALLSGTVDVVHREGQGEHRLATLGRGGVFGEISLLRCAAATADVVCRRAGFALLLPARDFREVIMTHPQFLEVVTSISEERSEANRAAANSRPGTGLDAQAPD